MGGFPEFPQVVQKRKLARGALRVREARVRLSFFVPKRLR